MDLVEHLHKGVSNGVTLKELMKLTGIDDRIEMKADIESARRNNVMILSRRGRYFLPSDGEQGKEEIRKFFLSMKSEGIEIR